MFFGLDLHAKKRRKALREANQKLQEIVNENFRKDSQSMRREAIEGGIKPEAIDQFLERVKYRLQVRAIVEFKKELQILKQEAKKSSTSGNGLSAEKKQSQHPTDDDHAAKRVKFATL